MYLEDKIMLKRAVAIILFLLAIAYVIWPLDIMPDIIPIVGWIDDVFVFLMGLFVLIKGIK